MPRRGGACLTVRAVWGGRWQSDSSIPCPAPRAPVCPGIVGYRRGGFLGEHQRCCLRPAGQGGGCSGCSAAGPHPPVETLEEGDAYRSHGSGRGAGLTLGVHPGLCPLCTLGPRSVQWGMRAVCMCTFVHLSVHMPLYIAAHTCVHVCTQVHMQVCVCEHSCICLYLCVHMHTSVCMHTCTCAHIVCEHACARVCS